MMIIGVDYHPSFQTIAFLVEETGEYGEQELNHSDGKAERFYRELKERGVSVRVGMEATGHARWFEGLLAQLGFELWIGDPAEIKAKRVRKQKTDREDARLMLKLLRENRFPKIWVPRPENRDLRQLLWHRHRLVQMRTRIMNQLQAVAGALREASYGNLAEARQAATTALCHAPLGHNAEAEGALALALAGDTTLVQSIIQGLTRHFPQNTLVQSVVLPTVQAQIELLRRNPERSIELLRTAGPYELTNASLKGCMYPTYVRGVAHLDAKQAAAAAAEFQKILDHRGLAGACETDALVHIQIGRAYAMQGDSAKAKAAYQDFLTLWKDADPDIPILKQAKAEYAKLE